MDKTNRYRLVHIVLACVIVGSVIFISMHKCCPDKYYQWTDEQKPIQTHVQFLTTLKYNYVDAYDMMSSSYKVQHSLKEFKKLANLYKDDPELRWRCLTLTGEKCRIGYVNSEGWTVGYVFEYVKEMGEWRFTGEVRQFMD